MKRGCLSDLTDQKTCKDDAKCATCATDGCNSRTYTYDQYKCIKCNDATKCQWGQTVAPENCDTKIPYYDEGGCYTETLPDKSVQRGCIRDRKTEGECKDTCQTCPSEGCNKLNTNSFTCIRCRSDEDPHCKNEPDKAVTVDGGKCRNIVPDGGAKCFSGLWSK